MDNLNTHCDKSLTDHLGHRSGRTLWRRLTVHPTPKHGSWLNAAELELSLWSRGCLGRRRIGALRPLQEDTRAWITGANRAKIRIRLQFTRRDARRKFGYQEN